MFLDIRDIRLFVVAFALYVVGRLLTNYEMYRADQGKDDFLNKLLVVAAYLCFIYGIIPTTFIYLVQIYPRKRLEKIISRETREECEKHHEIEINTLKRELHSIRREKDIQEAVWKDRESSYRYRIEALQYELSQRCGRQ